MGWRVSAGKLERWGRASEKGIITAYIVLGTEHGMALLRESIYRRSHSHQHLILSTTRLKKIPWYKKPTTRKPSRRDIYLHPASSPDSKTSLSAPIGYT